MLKARFAHFNSNGPDGTTCSYDNATKIMFSIKTVCCQISGFGLVALRATNPNVLVAHGTILVALTKSKAQRFC